MEGVYVCHRCGIRAISDAGFTKGNLCVSCAASSKTKKDVVRALEWWAWIALEAWLAFGDTPFAPMGKVLLTISVVGTLMIVIHESGHALVGRMLGRKVTGMTIGTGPPLLKIGKRFTFQVSVLPSGGHTTFALDESKLRVRGASSILAGPLADAAAVAVAWRWEPSADLAIIRTTILWIGVVHLVTNLFPWPSDGRDGPHLIRILRMADQERTFETTPNSNRLHPQIAQSPTD